MTVCEEMQKLRKMLDEKNIPWHDASEIMSESKEWPVWICRTHFEFKGLKVSVINGFGTYGGWYGANPGMTEDENMGLLEIMIEDNEPVGMELNMKAFLLILLHKQQLRLQKNFQF